MLEFKLKTMKPYLEITYQVLYIIIVCHTFGYIYEFCFLIVKMQ